MGQTSQAGFSGLSPLFSIVSALVCSGLGFVDIAVQAGFCPQAVEQLARSRQPVPQLLSLWTSRTSLVALGSQAQQSGPSRLHQARSLDSIGLFAFV